MFVGRTNWFGCSVFLLSGVSVCSQSRSSNGDCSVSQPSVCLDTVSIAAAGVWNTGRGAVKRPTNSTSTPPSAAFQHTSFTFNSSLASSDVNKPPFSTPSTKSGRVTSHQGTLRIPIIIITITIIITWLIAFCRCQYCCVMTRDYQHQQHPKTLNEETLNAHTSTNPTMNQQNRQRIKTKQLKQVHFLCIAHWAICLTTSLVLVVLSGFN